LGTDDPEDAESLCTRVEHRLRLLARGDLSLPEGARIETWLLSDGKLSQPIVQPASDGPKTLHDLFEHYFTSLPPGANEKSTLGSMQTHRKHLEDILGKRLPLDQLTTEKLQEYVNRRAKHDGRYGGKVTPITIRKAIITLRVAWRWGRDRGYVAGEFPGRNLRYPKGKEKPPFMTYAEIERVTKGMSEAAAEEYWDAMFLTVPEIEDMLGHVEKAAIQPFVHPMIAFAAFTGARRSEVLRAHVTDVDHESGIITIRERKRRHDQVTTRRVPIHPKLGRILKQWLEVHPGGPYLFCQQAEVFRSKSRSSTTGHKGHDRPTTLIGRLATVRPRERPELGPVTPDEANDHLKRGLAGTKWEVMRGYHTLRHSFISNAAAAGVDERMLDQWTGHTTEIRKRYLHLLPTKQKSAILAVFGRK
jgi:integrase